jgi:hypothetical protein
MAPRTLQVESVRIRETSEEGAAEALRDGRSPSERFELPSVRLTIELLERGPES